MTWTLRGARTLHGARIDRNQGRRGALASRHGFLQHLVCLVIVTLSIEGCGSRDREQSDERVRQLERDLAACRAAVLSPELGASEMQAPEEEVVPEEPEAAVAPASQWVTTEGEDELTRGTITTRTAMSREPFQLGSPYDGLQYARLTLRQHPRHGSDVLLSIEEGQIICHGRGCRVDVVFDDGDPISWRANEAASGSSTVVFLTQVERFERELRRANEVRIAVTLYREGTRIFAFPGLSEEAPAAQVEREP